jgi:AraC-like DNA-binding protein
MPGDWAERFRAAVSDGDDDAATVRRLDDAFSPLVSRRVDLDAAVMRAVFAIVHAQGQVAIGRLAQECGLSERHLRRRFVAAVGLSPKALARIRRLRASLVEALADPQGRWVELAAACGYADQAHLVREYRRLSGLAPEAFLAHLERIRHGRVTP